MGVLMRSVQVPYGIVRPHIKLEFSRRRGATRRGNYPYAVQTGIAIFRVRDAHCAQ